MANPAPSDHPADKDRISWLREELLMVTDEVAVMVDAGSYQAAMAGRRIMLTLRKELDDLAAEMPAADEVVDLAGVVREVLKLPDAVFSHTDIQRRVARCA